MCKAMTRTRKSMLAKFAISVVFLVMMLVPMNVVTAQEGQGTPWMAIPVGEAKENGKMTFQITVQYSHWFGKGEKTKPLEIDVQKGWDAERKAQELEAGLKTKFGDFLIVSREGDVVKAQLKKGARYGGADLLDIGGVTGGEYRTGETGITIRDDQISFPRVETVTFDVEGTPTDPEGVAILRIGWNYSKYSLVVVNTYGKSLPAIKFELVDQFNYYYAKMGFVARINDAGAVEIPDVPCSEGVTAGANDPALGWTLSMEDPVIIGGASVPVDKFGLLFPHIGTASAILAGTVAIAICVKRLKHRKDEP